MAEIHYTKVREALILTSDATEIYQLIADFLARERDLGRWTSLLSIHEHVGNHASDAYRSMPMERLRSIMGNLSEWGIVLSDFTTGVRSLKELQHARARYQLTPQGTLALRFRDEVTGFDAGNLNDTRPRAILEELKKLNQWVKAHSSHDSLTAESLAKLDGIRVSITDAVKGMKEDADRFYGRIESRVRDLSRSVEVPEGETHPLIEFRNWFRDYAATFVNEVQRLRTYGGECLAQIQDHRIVAADGEVLDGRAWLQFAWTRVERRGNLADTAEAEQNAGSIIRRLDGLVSSDGDCEILAVRAHAALDRYMAGVKRIRIRMGAITGTNRARMYSALAAKVAHLPDAKALPIAAVIAPERFGLRLLALWDFPATKVGRDAWAHKADWNVSLPGLIKGNPNFIAASPVKSPSAEQAERLRLHALAQQRETAFWQDFLHDGAIDIDDLTVNIEQANWLHNALVKGMVDKNRSFTLRTGVRVRIVWNANLDAVSVIHVTGVGSRMLRSFRLEVQ